MKDLISKILSTLGLLALIVLGLGVAFKDYLVTAGQQNPAMKLAAATDKIATDPFAAGPSLGNVLIIGLAIIGVLAILVAVGFSIYVLKTRQRYRDADRRRQRPYQHSPARPQIATNTQTQGGVGDALNALVQLETARYLRNMQGQQGSEQRAMLPPEQPLVVQQLGPDPVDDLLRDL